MSKKNKRPNWDEYFLEMVEFVGRRGTCDRGHAGAIIVKDKECSRPDMSVRRWGCLIAMKLDMKCIRLCKKTARNRAIASDRPRRTECHCQRRSLRCRH